MSGGLDELRAAAETARRSESAAWAELSLAAAALTAARQEYERRHRIHVNAHREACEAEVAVLREESRPGPHCPELVSLFTKAMWPYVAPGADDVVTVADKSDVRGKTEVRMYWWGHQDETWRYSRTWVSPAGVPHGKRKPAIDPAVLAECVERCARAREAGG